MKYLYRIAWLVPAVLFFACSNINERAVGTYRGEFLLDTLQDSGEVRIIAVDNDYVQMEFDFDHHNDMEIDDIAVVGDENGLSFYGYRMKYGRLIDAQLDLTYTADSVEISFFGIEP